MNTSLIIINYVKYERYNKNDSNRKDSIMTER